MHRLTPKPSSAPQRKTKQLYLTTEVPPGARTRRVQVRSHERRDPRWSPVSFPSNAVGNQPVDDASDEVVVMEEEMPLEHGSPRSSPQTRRLLNCLREQMPGVDLNGRRTSTPSGAGPSDEAPPSTGQAGDPHNLMSPEGKLMKKTRSAAFKLFKDLV